MSIEAKATTENNVPAIDTLLEKIKQFLFDTYKPVYKVDDTTIFKSTDEIFQSLQSFYPSHTYNLTDVAKWLDENGFMFTNTGTMRFEWMLTTA